MLGERGFVHVRVLKPDVDAKDTESEVLPLKRKRTASTLALDRIPEDTLKQKSKGAKNRVNKRQVKRRKLAVPPVPKKKIPVPKVDKAKKKDGNVTAKRKRELQLKGVVEEGVEKHEKAIPVDGVELQKQKGEPTNQSEDGDAITIAKLLSDQKQNLEAEFQKRFESQIATFEAAKLKTEAETQTDKMKAEHKTEMDKLKFELQIKKKSSLLKVQLVHI